MDIIFRGSQSGLTKNQIVYCKDPYRGIGAHMHFMYTPWLSSEMYQKVRQVRAEDQDVVEGEREEELGRVVKVLVNKIPQTRPAP